MNAVVSGSDTINRPPTEDERTFRDLVNGVRDYAIYMIDTNGIITTWNDGARNIKGYEAEEIIGKHFSIFCPEEDRAAGVPQEALRQAAIDGRWEGERRRIRKDGSSFWANIVLDAIRDESGEVIGFAKITRDITDRRDAEALQSQLWQAQKMEAVGQLTGGVAHDFNNLLQVILGGLELAERVPDRSASLKRHHHLIRKAAERGVTLVHSLLAFSRRQALQPDRIDPRKAITSAVDLLSHAVRGNVDIDVDVPSDLPAVEVDPTQFELAIVNLGMNSRDAMTDGGTLKVRAQRVVAGSDQGVERGLYIRIDIIDTGNGIPREIISKVLDPFFTTKGVGVGSGLGLSQAYGFSRQSGGNLTIESEVGIGTTVSMYLPSLEATQCQELEPDRKRILVVEDDNDLRELVVEVLEAEDYEVVEATNVAEAEDALKASSFDFVFSDVVMPGEKDGIELALYLREEYPELPVLLTSGYNDKQAGAGTRGIPLLSKPYGLRTLTDRISSMIAGRSVPSC